MIEPVTVLSETVHASEGAVMAPKETAPTIMLPLTLLPEITDVSTGALVCPNVGIADWLLMLPVTMLFVIIDEATVIWVFMMQLSIFMGLMLDIEVWSIMEFSIMQPESVCSFQPLLEAVNVICPPLKVILSDGPPTAFRVPFTSM